MQKAMGRSILLLIVGTSVLFVLLQHSVLSDSSSTQVVSSIHKSAPGEHDLHMSCDQWVVITSIQKITPAITTVLQQPNWCVVVVGDAKSPTKKEYYASAPPHTVTSSLVYLDLETQQSLSYSIVELLPRNSYGRKNIGYLYAIDHGAHVIYETDDDNQLIEELESAFLSDNELLPNYDSRSCAIAHHSVNPYAHFGQPSIWPRGYPLSAISQPDCTRFVRRPVNSWIQQSLANGDPDVDAIFRLTRKTHEEPITIAFDADADPVALPSHLYCPYNSQNTLHYYDAFWALMLPVGVSFRVSDIWRSYWAQRLLWQVGGQLVFLRPLVYQERNAHDYTQDFREELQLYTDTERLIDFLQSWLPNEPDFVKQIQQLSWDMAEAGFWSERDAELVQAWCVDLIRLGYHFPPLSHDADSHTGESIQLLPTLLPTTMMKHLIVSSSQSVLRVKQPHVRVFICILAAPGETMLRDVVRDTYLTLLADLPAHSVEYRFFTDFKDKATHQALLKEQALYGDLHITEANVHCPEGRHCRTSFGLVLDALRWSLDTQSFDYFLRLDLDGYLCLPQLVRDLEHRPKHAYMAGNFGCHGDEPDRFFRADEAFVLFTPDLAQLFLDMQPWLFMDPSNTFALNFASFVFGLNVTLEHRRWSTNVSAICERQVFAHWLKTEQRIRKAHTYALPRIQAGIPVTPLRNICEERVRAGKVMVHQHSPFWGEHSMDVRRHWYNE